LNGLTTVPEDEGKTGPPLLPTDDPFPLAFGTPSFGGPTEIDAGASFNAVANTGSIKVPASVDTGIQGIGVGGEGVVNLNAAANLIYTFRVNGAASIGTPTLAGGNVIGASVAKNGSDTFVLKLPGDQVTDNLNFQKTGLPDSGTVKGDEHMFKVSSNPNTPKTFNSPQITIPITAGAANTTVQITLIEFQADSDADVFDNAGHVLVRAFCDPSTNNLGTVQVVTPPPPGAPDAVADVASTDQGTAVTIAVLDNDTANEQLAIDENSLAVIEDPAHGSATVNADRTISYTPDGDFVGTDQFRYQLCSVPAEVDMPASISAEQVEAPCDTAIVTVNVFEPVVVPPVPHATTSTTQDVSGGDDELPRTGKSSVPVATIGFGLILLGTGAVLVTRRNHATS
jgi:LPXTG-motif cell wall-anchored protein